MTDEDHGATEAAATHQPTLPDLELPEYHGQKPVGMRTSVSGTGNRLTRPHGIGDRAVLVLEVKCNESGHKEIDDALYYAEKHKVADMFELDRDEGSRLLRHLRRTYATAGAEARGQSQLESPTGEVFHADDNGVILTDREIAERRGDILHVLGAQDLTPTVVIYADGNRLLWPDEYPAATIRPAIGQHSGDSGHGDFDSEVVELLHHETGEPVVDVATVEVSIDADGFAEAVEYFGGRPVTDAPAVDDWEQTPADHRAMPDDGGYGNVEPYDAPAKKADAAPAPALPGEEDLALILPTAADFELVNRAVPLLREKLAEVDDVDHVRRLLEAEKQGRGQGHKARRGALDAIHSRLAELGAPA